MVTVMIVGGRDFNNYKLLMETLDNFISDHDVKEFICSSNFGADTFGEAYAVNHGYPVRIFDDSEEGYGERALEYAMQHDGYMIAFWNGKSAGTKYMINLAKEKGMNVKVVGYVS